MTDLNGSWPCYSLFLESFIRIAKLIDKRRPTTTALELHHGEITAGNTFNNIRYKM